MKESLIFISIFLLIKIIKCGSSEDIILSSSKYKNIKYINSYKIPYSLMSLYSKGGEQYNHQLNNAFDGDYDTYWRSIGIQGSKFTNSETQKVYESLINSIFITFSKTININRILYKAPLVNGKERGYPIKFSVYYKIKDINGKISDEENDFLLFDEIISESTESLILFTFEEIIECDQIKLEWNELSDENDGYAYASEIILLYPENKNLDKLIFDVFNINDYTYLDINKEYKNIEIIDNLIEDLKDIYDNSDYLKDLFKRIKNIINGTIKYELEREFSTNQTSKYNKIYQRGNTYKKKRFS